MQKYKKSLEISNKLSVFWRFQDDNDYVNGIFCIEHSGYALLIQVSQVQKLKELKELRQ